MIQNFYNYEQNLPKTIKSKERFNDAYSAALNAVKEAKLHWSALLSTPEIKDRCKDIDVALDEKESIIDYYSKKIEDVEALPVPPSEKAKMLQEWQSAMDKAEKHLNALEDAFDTLPCGYISYEEDNPESIAIKSKDLMEYATNESKIQIPDEARELYSKFLAAIQAINDFHTYEREKGYNERDFISIIGHIHNAEEFASNFIYGTWKKYI